MLNLLALSLSSVHCVQLLSAIRRNIHLLRIVYRDWRRIPTQIAQLPKRPQEQAVVPIHHLHRVFNGILLAYAQVLEASI